MSQVYNSLIFTIHQPSNLPGGGGGPPGGGGGPEEEDDDDDDEPPPQLLLEPLPDLPDLPLLLHHCCCRPHSSQSHELLPDYILLEIFWKVYNIIVNQQYG